MLPEWLSAQRLGVWQLAANQRYRIAIGGQRSANALHTAVESEIVGYGGYEVFHYSQVNWLS